MLRERRSNSRTCVCCREKLARSELHRFVVTEAGVLHDATKCASGRGAWACEKCLERDELGVRLLGSIKKLGRKQIKGREVKILWQS